MLCEFKIVGVIVKAHNDNVIDLGSLYYSHSELTKLTEQKSISIDQTFVSVKSLSPVNLIAIY